MSATFLYQEIYQSLLNDILSGNYKSGDILPSEKELCKKYDVSLITIRRALTQLESENIINKCKGKGSFVNSQIRGSGDCKNKNLGILYLNWSGIITPSYDAVPFNSKLYNRNDWDNTIYSVIYRKLSSEYNIIIGTYDHDFVLNHFEETVFQNVDRILIIGIYTSELIDMFQSKGKFIVVYNNFNKNLRVCSVSGNERQSCCELITKLIELGHRRIACINGDINFSESVERFMGYQEALMINNVPLYSEIIKWGNRSSESGYYTAKSLLDSDNPPTAIVCVNDSVAAGAIFAIREAGFDCPKDISVVGHDNNIMLHNLDIPVITSIDSKFELVGEILAEKLIRDVWIDDFTTIETEIVTNGTIAPANKKH